MSLSQAVFDCTVLLEEKPAKESDYKAHEQIAESLYRTIQKEEKSSSIALIGKLGIGKSTTIELLREKTREDSSDPGIIIFEYDAWTHSGDSIRRSFLQELIQWLRTEHKKGKVVIEENSKSMWLWSMWPWGAEDTPSDGLWNDDYKKVVNQSQKTEETSRTHLSWQGAALAFAVLLFQMGYFLFARPGEWYPDWFWLVSGENVGYIGFIVLCVATAPLTLATIMFIYKWVTDSGGLVERKVDSETNTLSDRQSPSTYDFRSSFESVVEDVLTNDENPQLVVVIDDIDRLDPQEVKDNWALLQTFFDIRGRGEEDWRNRLWTIVPFDEGKLEENEVYHQKDGDNSGLSKFIDKTFQVKQIMPNLVYTEWRTQVKSFLEEAFEGCTSNSGLNVSSDALDNVEELMDLYVPAQGISGGKEMNMRRHPRDAKRFINDLVMSYRAFSEEQFPLEVHAFHLLELRRSSVKMPVLTSNNGSGGPLYNEVASILNKRKGTGEEVTVEDIRRYTTALDFGVDEDTAKQYRIREEIRRALNDESDSDLVELKKECGDDFPVLLESSSRSAVIRAPGHIIANHVHAISKLPAKDKATPKIAKIVGRYARAVLRTETWEPLNEETGYRVGSIVGIVESDSVKKDIRESIFRTLSKSIDQRHNKRSNEKTYDSVPLDEVREELKDWADFVVAFAERVIEEDGQVEEEMSAHLKIPGSPEVFVEVARLLAKGLEELDVDLAEVEDSFKFTSESVSQKQFWKRAEALALKTFEDNSSVVHGEYLYPMKPFYLAMPEWKWAGDVLQTYKYFSGSEEEIPFIPEEQELSLLLPSALNSSLTSENQFLKTKIWERINSCKGVSSKAEAASILTAVLWCADPSVRFFTFNMEANQIGEVVKKEDNEQAKAGYERFKQIVEHPENEPDILDKIKIIVDRLDIAIEKMRCSEAEYDMESFLSHLEG